MIDKTIPIMQAGRVQRKLTLEKALIIQENDQVKSIPVININPKAEKYSLTCDYNLSPPIDPE